VKFAQVEPNELEAVSGSEQTVNSTVKELCFLQSHFVGAAVGLTVGDTDGCVLGEVVGLGEGIVVGDVVGKVVGDGVGIVVSGERDGWSDVGIIDGEVEGIGIVGDAMGCIEGHTEGKKVGFSDGATDGITYVGA